LIKDSHSNSYNTTSHIIANSLFTKRQIDIIYKKLNKADRPTNLTRGAYYRQKKQCKEKVRRLLYSLLLFRALNIIDKQTLFAIERISEQLTVMFDSNNSDIFQLSHNESVMYTIDELIKRMNTL
jgi:hypothetical protein